MGRIKPHLNRAKKVAGTTERPRLAIKKTLTRIIAQIIDDQKGITLVYADSGSLKSKNIDTAKKIGQELAKKAIAAGISKVAFDRRQYLYHGKVKALADAARAAGLSF
jgi:large subunit ribosomal protein L18